jgi:hypothetical protein
MFLQIILTLKIVLNSVGRCIIWNIYKNSCKYIFVKIFQIMLAYIYVMGTAVAQWLRCCATNRKASGSIPAGVTGILHPSDRILTEMSTWSISWG